MKNTDKLKEECGVFGVSLNVNEAVGVVYNGLLSLQHRGQEGAGIATIADNNIRCHKELGLVTEIFSQKVPKLLKSSVAVGHVRYNTKGECTKDDVGPFVREYLTGRIVISHNGNVTNTAQIKDRLKQQGLYFKSTSDSEVIAALVAFEIQETKDLAKGVEKACGHLEGAFSLLVACGDGTIVAVRDPIGFRPLCIGSSNLGLAIASESAALEAAGFDLQGDVKPGELIIIKNAKIVERKIVLKPKSNQHGLCAFEFVYFARPDSIIDGLGVYAARQQMGRILAQEAPVDVDYIIGVPDSGLPAAHGYAEQSGIPLTTGFVKNRYVGRSFIYPTQELRESIVRVKLNPLKSSIEGKRIVLVDDSIVRGTTISRIVASLRKAGAKEVHVRVSSPPFMHSCIHGTRTDDDKDLIARRMKPEAMAKNIGADSVAFISLEGLLSACGGCTSNLCTACF